MLTVFNFNLSGLMTEMNTENKKFKSKQADEATVPSESKRVFDYQLQLMILYAEFCLRLEENRPNRLLNAFILILPTNLALRC